MQRNSNAAHGKVAGIDPSKGRVDGFWLTLYRRNSQTTHAAVSLQMINRSAAARNGKKQDDGWNPNKSDGIRSFGPPAPASAERYSGME